MMQSRTHTCGELRLTDAGKTVTIVGWLENVREVGSNFAFCVLRDYYGTTQVVIENEEMMRIIKPINKESTLSVTGVVRERESGLFTSLRDFCTRMAGGDLNKRAMENLIRSGAFDSLGARRS